MTAATAEVQAAVVAIGDLVRRDGWQQDAGIAPELRRVLSKLSTIRVDVELLKSTGVGKLVKKVGKHDDEVVKGYSASLMKKWKQQVGVEDDRSDRRSAEMERLESARKKLQENYATAKAERKARTVQVLSRPITKRRGTTISAAPTKSSLSRLSAPRRPLSTTMSTSSSVGRQTATTPPARRPMQPPHAQARPATAPPASMDPHEANYLRRREKLLRAREHSIGSNGRELPTPNRAIGARGGSAANGASRKAPKAAPPASVNARKEMLDRMYPRVLGVGADSAAASKKGGAGAGKSTGSKKRKEVTYSQGQREVLQWLQGLDVDMSAYAQAFFDNGFDSIKLLNEIKSRDLESMVPKAGHQRMIEKALNELKRKHATAASARPRSATRDREPPRRKPRRDPYFDEESDDSFVVSDGDEYAPGAITAMLRKGRKRRLSIDSTDSYNMEASYEEIQHEEERSKRIGEYEDYREELRNEKLSRKRK